MGPKQDLSFGAERNKEDNSLSSAGSLRMKLSCGRRSREAEGTEVLLMVIVGIAIVITT